MRRWHRVKYGMRAGVDTLRTFDFGATLATVQDAVDERCFLALAEVLRADPDGRALLAERPRVTLGTLDPSAMAALPDGTLGRELHRHLATNDLLRDVEIPPSPFELPDEAAYAKLRWRETHDFRHVVTGLGTSIRDEIVLQAFQYGQFANRFAIVQMSVGPWLSPTTCLGPTLIRDYRAAIAAGRRAAPLITARWERWLTEPVSAVRARLGVDKIGRTYAA
jgi:ubiquinone biosynthesis protein COQ4